ncbi:MAG: DUF2961 domain-containing protein [Polyangiales bacterium]
MAERALAAAIVLACGCDETPAPRYTPIVDAARDDSGDVIIVDAPVTARTLPVVPVGLDGYRMWARLPQVRIGVRAVTAATDDPGGGVDDAGNFLRATRDTFYAVAEWEGPGVLYGLFTNRWRGSPWHLVVDGFDRVVRESTSATPDAPVDPSTFEPPAALPPPLALTWSSTRGADANLVPVAFATSLSVGFARTHRATGDLTAHRFAEGADHLSRPLRPWDGASPPDADVVALLGRAGSDLAPTGGELQSRLGTVDVPADGAAVLDAAGAGPATIRALQLSVAREDAAALGRARLRITWDGRAAPSVDAPVALFFGAGVVYNRDVREHLVKALLTTVRYAGVNVELAAYFPMPYFRGARVELVGTGEAVPRVSWRSRSEPLTDSPDTTAYFHATARDHGTPVAGVDLDLLDTSAVEGGGTWCGHLVGAAFTYSDRASADGLAGDPRFYFDDAVSAQAHGTSVGAWAGGAPGWGGATATLPLFGHPAGAPDLASARDADDRVQSAYRHLVADAMPFGRNARVRFEHGAANDVAERYRTVAFWYGRPNACLFLTDSVDVGDAADEAAHRYATDPASPPEMLTSRYEHSIDRVAAGAELPAFSDAGRRVTGTSEFTLRIDPANVGVMLRRTLDRALPDQRAEVSVADDREGAGFQPAGVWYTAGSTERVYSNPATETGINGRDVRTSPRRFGEDEFLLPRRLTEGRSAVRVRVRHAPAALPLVPGGPARARAWSEFRYAAYSYVLP